MSNDLQSAADADGQGLSKASHIEDFKQFINDLNEASKVAFPKNIRYYDCTCVLLLRWEDDDLGTEKEISELDDVFTNDFDYVTERYLIPSVDSEHKLELRLCQFRDKHDNKGNNLLILYYGGHGALDSSYPGQSVWAATKNQDSVTLLWTQLQDILERAKSNVVFILDCCFAATATRGTQSGSNEGLWACNSQAKATAVNDNSFTRNLIAELKAVAQGAAPCSIAMLHQRLMQRYETFNTATPPGPKLFIEPWYSYLSDFHSASILLRPQGATHATEPDVDKIKNGTKVLLAVHLKSPDLIPSLENWIIWLHQNCPHDVDYVHGVAPIKLRDLISLQGTFLSHSSLALVSIPIVLFDRLPDHDAYKFVGMIKSDNELLSDPRTCSPVRPHVLYQSFSSQQPAIIEEIGEDAGLEDVTTSTKRAVRRLTM